MDYTRLFHLLISEQITAGPKIYPCTLQQLVHCNHLLMMAESSRFVWCLEIGTHLFGFQHIFFRQKFTYPLEDTVHCFTLTLDF